MAILRLVILITLFQSAALAQQSATISRPQFEVISIKANKSPEPDKALMQFLPGGRFVATDIPLIQVIAVAWNLPRESQRLTFAPTVKKPDDIYDIEATAPQGAFPQGITQDARLTKMRLMLQALLEDRFKLSIRREPKEEPVYLLVTGKDGSKLEKSQFQAPSCGDSSPNWIRNPACHFLDGDQNRGMHGGSVTMTQIVEFLQNFTDRPLFDKTGLSGYYNIETQGWAPMRLPLGGAPRDDASTTNSDRPSLFDIFQKVGLRMESRRAIIDMFVIDHVEAPSPN
jgi:uncharacterized protein (TIGR03435 family)